MMYGSTFQMAGAAQQKARATILLCDGYSLRCWLSVDDLKECCGTLDVIPDHRFAGSLDSSSLYVMVGGDLGFYSSLDRQPVELLQHMLMWATMASNHSNHAVYSGNARDVSSSFRCTKQSCIVIIKLASYE